MRLNEVPATLVAEDTQNRCTGSCVDIVDLLRNNGYGVVEGADEVKMLIEMMEKFANGPTLPKT